jgi:hypothetical protein
MATMSSPVVFSSSQDRIDDLLFRICTTLQLSDTQYKNAKQSYEAICNWLDAPDSELKVYFPKLYPQGSVALGTTVRPMRYDEYDVDLVCELLIDSATVHDPVYLLNILERRLLQSGTYRAMVERKNRCIRVNYARQFHLDILPACPDFSRNDGSLLIPDRKLADFTKTNPKGFKAWFKLQSLKRRWIGFDEAMTKAAAPLPAPESAHQKEVLNLVVQLLKRWRDVHYAENCDLAPVSIVLTTLAGMHFQGHQSLVESAAVIVLGILDSLPAYGRLVVRNPANSEEDLSDRWNEPRAYIAFVHGMRVLYNELQEIRLAANVVDASRRIKRLFGEDVTVRVFDEQMAEAEPFRSSGRLLVTSAASLTTVPALARVPVQQNTFYGD